MTCYLYFGDEGMQEQWGVGSLSWPPPNHGGHEGWLHSETVRRCCVA